MVKNKGLDERLLEEVQNGEVGELHAQIQALRGEAQKKQESIESFKAQIQEKEREARRLREEAERCLGRGEDPMPLLDQAVQIENQVKGMRELLPSGESRPDASELKEIEGLQKKLDGALIKAINGSDVAGEVAAEFEKKLRELQDLVERWDEAQQSTGRAFNSRARGSALKIRHDAKLQKFTREVLGNIGGPFA
jgi:chromosome segregation ATPase